MIEVPDQGDALAAFERLSERMGIVGARQHELSVVKGLDVGNAEFFELRARVFRLQIAPIGASPLPAIAK